MFTPLSDQDDEDVASDTKDLPDDPGEETYTDPRIGEGKSEEEKQSKM